MTTSCADNKNFFYNPPQQNHKSGSATGLGTTLNNLKNIDKIFFYGLIPSRKFYLAQ